MKKHVGYLAALLAAGTLGISSVSASDYSGRNQQKVGSQDASLTDTEVGALNTLAPKIVYLYNLSETAVKKASDPKMKELAGKVLGDYNNMKIQFRKVTANHSFTYREGLDMKQKQDIDNLAKLPPDQFDAKYREDVSRISGEVAQVFLNNHEQVRAADLKKFMEESYPLIQAHQKMADGKG